MSASDRSDEARPWWITGLAGNVVVAGAFSLFALSVGVSTSDDPVEVGGGAGLVLTVLILLATYLKSLRTRRIGTGGEDLSRNTP